jgi:hypothetical protein
MARVLTKDDADEIMGAHKPANSDTSSCGKAQVLQQTTNKLLEFINAYKAGEMSEDVFVHCTEKLVIDENMLAEVMKEYVPKDQHARSWLLAVLTMMYKNRMIFGNIINESIQKLLKSNDKDTFVNIAEFLGKFLY